MLLHDSEIGPEQAKELDKLFDACFGIDFFSSPRAKLRAVNGDGGIRAHAAVELRPITIRHTTRELALLGLVCVHPESRGNREGQAMIRELHAAVDLPFILNCGSTLVPYYSELGYELVSESASYDRAGTVVVDADPVLLFANNWEAGIGLLAEPVHIGRDF